MLTDRIIRQAMGEGRLDIFPFNPDYLEPASYDLTLGDKFKIFLPSVVRPEDDKFILDPANPVDMLYGDYQGHEIIIPPHGCVLATTEQRVTLGDEIIGRVEGKSSLGRLFQLIHCTAGYIDPGFDGEITLEIVNLLPVPIKYYAGQKVAQLSFLPALDMANEMWGYAAQPYRGKYQGQTGPAIPQMWRNFQ